MPPNLPIAGAVAHQLPAHRLSPAITLASLLVAFKHLFEDTRPGCRFSVRFLVQLLPHDRTCVRVPSSCSDQIGKDGGPHVRCSGILAARICATAVGCGDHSVSDPAHPTGRGPRCRCQVASAAAVDPSGSGGGRGVRRRAVGDAGGNVPAGVRYGGAVRCAVDSCDTPGGGCRPHPSPPAVSSDTAVPNLHSTGIRPTVRHHILWLHRRKLSTGWGGLSTGHPQVIHRLTPVPGTGSRR